MGHATSLGLGLAIAQPERRVIVLSGDGSLLMNLGSLVTIATETPRNLTVVVFDNGVYEVTGAQPTPGSAAARTNGDPVDFAGLARASGIRTVFEWESLGDWERGAAEAFSAAGPVVVILRVVPTAGAVGPRSPGPAAARAARFSEAVREREESFERRGSRR
jgi:thiamine pyrophosphate-dependent acetolactate synthase large subunit-like protein